MSVASDPRQPTVQRALLLFGVASALSWWLTWAAPLALTASVRQVQFVGYWSAAALATWWGTSTVSPLLRWPARLSCAGVLAAMSSGAGLLRMLPVHPNLLPLAQDAALLTWATLFSLALAAATRRASTFFGRAWLVLVGYRLVLHAASWPEAFGYRLLGDHAPLLTASGQALMLILVVFSWISLRSPETPSAPS